jgi:uncharacterized protein
MPAGAITLDDITAADWSLTLDANSAQSAASNQIVSGSGIGQVVQGVADINQCIGTILSTPQGSDPLRPTFACDVWRWLDAPLTIARPALVGEIVEAITRWEPRVRMLRVQVGLATPDATANINAHLAITIVWQLKVDVAGAGQQRLTITVPRNLA